MKRRSFFTLLAPLAALPLALKAKEQQSFAPIKPEGGVAQGIDYALGSKDVAVFGGALVPQRVERYIERDLGITLSADERSLISRVVQPNDTATVRISDGKRLLVSSGGRAFGVSVVL